MDPVETAQTLIARATHLLHLQPNAILPLSSETLVASLVTIRALLDRIAESSHSDSDIATFCTLTSLESIHVLLECRRHPECARVDSWSNILLADLSKFTSKYLLREDYLESHTHSNLNRVLSRMQLDACSQLPALWESCLASLGRQETSPMARIVILRLLYLTTVVQPRLSHCKPSESLIISVMNGLPFQLNYLLQDAPFVSSNESLALTIGILVEVEDGQLSHSFLISGLSELLSLLFGDYRTGNASSRSLFTQTSLVPCVIRIVEATDTSFSDTFLNLVADWLVFTGEDKGRWTNHVIPALQVAPRVLTKAFDDILKNLVRTPDVPYTPLLGPLVQGLLSLSTFDASSSMGITQRTNQFDTLAVLFFHLDGQHSHVKHNIIKYLFHLHSQPGHLAESEWRRRACEEALTQLESCITRSDEVLDQTGHFLVSLLICLLHQSSLTQTSDNRLRDICNRLLGCYVGEKSDVSEWILRQNTLILSGHVEGLVKHPLVTHLPEHLDEFLQATLSAHSLEHHARTFIQHVNLLTGRSLLHKCPNDQICTAFQYLFDIIFLAIQGYLECDQQTADKLIAEICKVLTALLATASESSVEYLASSPWCFTLRRELEQGMVKGEISRAHETCNLLKMLEQIMTGKGTEALKSVRERRVTMKEINETLVVFFVE